MLNGHNFILETAKNMFLVRVQKKNSKYTKFTNLHSHRDIKMYTILEIFWLKIFFFVDALRMSLSVFTEESPSYSIKKKSSPIIIISLEDHKKLLIL